MELREIKTSSNNIDFALLVAELDLHLTEFYGNEKHFFEAHNKVDSIKNVIVIYNNNNPVGCGGIKEYSNTEMEIKRMYVKPTYRGQGIASTILKLLENWAIELGYTTTILETMKVKETVINMYAKNGYRIIPNYGQYQQMDKSICMSKDLYKKE